MFLSFKRERERESGRERVAEGEREIESAGRKSGRESGGRKSGRYREREGEREGERKRGRAEEGESGRGGEWQRVMKSESAGENMKRESAGDSMKERDRERKNERAGGDQGERAGRKNVEGEWGRKSGREIE